MAVICKYLSLLYFLTLSAYKNHIEHDSQISQQNVDYTKVDQFFIPSFINDDVGRKIITPSKKISCQMLDKYKG